MATEKKIKTALVSVFHKDGLDDIIKMLHADGVEFLSTGGTQSFIESLGIPCNAVEDLTGYPSILGGRVKTLHPKVFGGILNRRDNETDAAQITEYEIPSIDLVIVDLYPFEQTVASGAEEAAIIEKIDIGGISLIRAAAKNFNDVAIVASKGQYGILLDMVGDPSATFPREYYSMLYASSYVEQIWRTAISLGYGRYFMGTAAQNTAFSIVDDHYYVNTIAGIPCVDVIDYSTNSETGFPEWWHTQHDDMRNINKQTLQAVGETVITTICSK